MNIEVGSVITLDNDMSFTVLRIMKHNNKEYALITDFKNENHVINIINDNDGVSVSLIDDAHEEELIANIFLKDTLNELKEYEEQE